MKDSELIITPSKKRSLPKKKIVKQTKPKRNISVAASQGSTVVNKKKTTSAKKASSPISCVVGSNKMFADEREQNVAPKQKNINNIVLDDNDIDIYLKPDKIIIEVRH